MGVNADTFRKALAGEFEKATAAGRDSVRINAGELHRSVGQLAAEALCWTQPRIFGLWVIQSGVVSWTRPCIAVPESDAAARSNSGRAGPHVGRTGEGRGRRLATVGSIQAGFARPLTRSGVAARRGVPHGEWSWRAASGGQDSRER